MYILTVIYIYIYMFYNIIYIYICFIILYIYTQYYIHANTCLVNQWSKLQFTYEHITRKRVVLQSASTKGFTITGANQHVSDPESCWQIYDWLRFHHIFFREIAHLLEDVH